MAYYLLRLTHIYVVVNKSHQAYKILTCNTCRQGRTGTSQSTLPLTYGRAHPGGMEYPSVKRGPSPGKCYNIVVDLENSVLVTFLLKKVQ